MPVCLLGHIIQQRTIAPSHALKHLIDCFIVSPFTAGLVLNDGLPAIAFAEHNVTFTDHFSDDAWLTGPYMENVHVTGDGALLVVRFNPV